MTELLHWLNVYVLSVDFGALRVKVQQCYTLFYIFFCLL